MKVWAHTDDGKYRIENLSDCTLDGALNVLRESFCVDEAVCIGTEMMSSPRGQEEMKLLSLDTIRDGLSLVAVTNDEKQEVVAVAFNKLQILPEPGELCYFDKFQSERCQDESSRSLIIFMMTVDAKTDLYKMYDVDCIFEIMFLATLKNHRHKGLATLLCHCSWLLAKEIKDYPKPIKKFDLPQEYADFVPLEDKSITKNPGLCSAIFTSNASQKVGDRAGFDNILEVSYEEFIYKGKSYASRIGPQSPTTKLAVKKIK